MSYEDPEEALAKRAAKEKASMAKAGQGKVVGADGYKRAAPVLERVDVH